MPTRHYALAHGEPRRLVAAWKRDGTSLRLTLDACDLVPAPHDPDEYPLPDGSSLFVRWLQDGAALNLALVRDGKLLPGSAFDPHVQLRLAYSVLGVSALLHFGLSLASAHILPPSLASLPTRTVGTLIGATYVALALLVFRHSRVAAVLATGLLGAESLFLVLLALFSGFVGIKWVVLPLGLGALVFQAVDAIAAIDAETPATGSSRPS